jgi:putative ABC transport system permease protein
MKNETPPQFAQRLLQRFLRKDLAEDVYGDLNEKFYSDIKCKTVFKAKLNYWYQVFNYLRPFAIQKSKASHLNQYDMVQSYFKIGWRNLLKNKGFSFINITGLALGMTCCLFIYLWVQDERAVDNFHAQGKTLYNIYQTASSGGQANGSYNTPIELIIQGNSQSNIASITAQDMNQVVPEIRKICSYATGYELPWGHPETFQVGEKIQKFSGSRAGKDFFTLFNYPLIAGDTKASLQDISSISISRKMAEFFFQRPQDAIGKTLRYESKIDFVVNAVFENVSPQSSLTFDFLINWDSQLKQLEWASPVLLTTLQLDANANIGEVEIKLNRFLQSRLDMNKNPTKITVGLQPYSDKYLYGTFVNGKPAAGRMEYVRIFTGVAIFILIIACINFMNLATARSVKRAKEVGVRKVIGSTRFNLIGQFLGESILLSFIALGVSILLMQIFLSPFDALTGKQIASPIIHPSYWATLLGLMLFTGIVAGSYPALYLSSLKPVKILKGTLRFTNSSIWFRKGLVCFQFVLSIVLLIATLVVSNQTRFAQNKNLGYDRDNLLYIQLEGELSLSQKYALFKERVLKMPGIAMVDRSSEAPHAMKFVVDDSDGLSETDSGDDAVNWEGKENNTSVGFKPASVGFDFIKIMNLKVAEGRDFSKAFATDSADAFMVNEEAVKQMGMKDPIGKWVSAWKKKGHIIGILKDYHTNTLHEPIKPVIIDVKEYEYFGVIIVRLEPGKTQEALASLQTVCKEINPNYPFAFQFLDQEYDKLYRNEQVITKLTNIFAVLGIAISCLGLLGLVMLTAEQRTKEIGIRKVLGATVTNIISLLSKEFIILVSISFLIAAPIAGYFMYQWLLGFAYKIELSWWIFALAGTSTAAIAFVTISIQAVQAAVVNPVSSLKSE